MVDNMVNKDEKAQTYFVTCSFDNINAQSVNK